MKVVISSGDLGELRALLHDVATEVTPRARRVLVRGALNIKNDWRRRWSGLAHAPALPYAISYDTASRGYTASAEIGPDKAKRQGSLGNLIEYGSVNNPPHPGGSPALDAEEPKFQRALEDLGTKLLEERL